MEEDQEQASLNWEAAARKLIVSFPSDPWTIWNSHIPPLWLCFLFNSTSTKKIQELGTLAALC